MNTQPITHKNPQKFNLLKQHILKEIHTLNYNNPPHLIKISNFPVFKRLRPSDSEQTKMSIDELRFKDAHEYEEFPPNYYEQQYYDYNQYHGLINEGQQPTTIHPQYKLSKSK